MSLSEVLAANDYKRVLQHFLEISAVPRGSGYNEKISNWLCEFAKAHEIAYEQDAVLNVILRKPASKGYENAPAVVLQGHMDMVCVKNADCSHDFINEGLSVLSDGAYIFADGTTLGADDGIALAYMLSLLTDSTLQHPELICLITTDEETGMDGAREVKSEKISAPYLINIDSEEEGVCWCGCAGGQRIEIELPLQREECSGYCVEVSIGGLSGGHSGADIHKYIPNAVHVLGRLLSEVSEKINIRVLDMNGGEKDNSIPVNSAVRFIVSDSGEANKVIAEVAEAITAVYGRSQKNLQIQSRIAEVKTCELSLSKECQEKFLFLLNQLPDGVQSMSTQIPELVETSINLGIFEMTANEAVYHLSLRSSVAYELQGLSKKVKQLAAFVGAVAESGSDYPAWEYRAESKLRELFCETYSLLYDEKPRTAAIHAGLECGLFCQKFPNTDMISVGPNMHDIHTPKERLEIASAVRVYRVLEHMLNNIRG